MKTLMFARPWWGRYASCVNTAMPTLLIYEMCSAKTASFTWSLIIYRKLCLKSCKRHQMVYLLKESSTLHIKSSKQTTSCTKAASSTETSSLKISSLASQELSSSVTLASRGLSTLLPLISTLTMSLPDGIEHLSFWSEMQLTLELLMSGPLDVSSQRSSTACLCSRVTQTFTHSS